MLLFVEVRIVIIYVIDVGVCDIEALGVFILEYFFFWYSQDGNADIHIQGGFFFGKYQACEGLAFLEDNRVGTQVGQERKDAEKGTAGECGQDDLAGVPEALSVRIVVVLCFHNAQLQFCSAVDIVRGMAD